MTPSSPHDNGEDAVERLQAHVSNTDPRDRGLLNKVLSERNKEHSMHAWLQSVQVVSAEKLTNTTAKAVFRFPVTVQYLNPALGLQGGLQSAMFDVLTTLTFFPIRKPGFWNYMGTTRTMNVSYINTAMEGDWLRMECEIVHAGKRLAFIRGTLLREKDGKLVSTCEHHKFNIDPEVAKV